MSQTIKISDEEANILRAEAPLFSRSIAGQAEHWIRIGRAIEKSSSFNHQRIKDALQGLISSDDLNAEEGDVFLEEFSQSLGQETPQQTAYFAERKNLGLGVGLDGNNKIIQQEKENH